MNFLKALHELPSGTGETVDLIASFDECFVAGFANLDSRHQETLASLQRVFTGTPLGQPFSDSRAALERNEFIEGHFTVLAAVRAALQGSVFDSLQQQVREVLGRSPDSNIVPENIPPIPPDNLRVWLESIRHWLMEISLVGWARLEATSLTPFMTTLEEIQAEPLLVRQAALLTGFFNELMSRVPISDRSSIPTYRWADLWMRGTIGAMRPSVGDRPQVVSGTLELLGLDLRHHANLVSFTASGLLTVEDKIQWVRATLSAYKVDAIAASEIWLLFPDAMSLLEAFAQNKALLVNDLSLLPTGDLLWNGKAELGSKFNLMKKAEEFFAPDAAKDCKFSDLYPVDRHPVQLAEPIFLKDYTVTEAAGKLKLNWGENGELAVATERISPFAEVTKEAIASSSQLFGLLRFDAGKWGVQPLAATQGKKTIFTGQTAAKLLQKPSSKSTVATLQERASYLLRKKS